MKKIIACLPILSILIMSCTTFSPVGRDAGKFPKPEQGAGIDIVKARGGEKDVETISVDQDMILPPPTGPEPVVHIDIRDAAKLWAALVVIRVLRLLREMVTSFPNIPW